MTPSALSLYAKNSANNILPNHRPILGDWISVKIPPHSSIDRALASARRWGQGLDLYRLDLHLEKAQFIIGYEISYQYRSPLGRTAGRLASLLNSKIASHIFDLGVGLGIDVGYQAWLDYDNPYLTTIQYRRRLFVTGVGSGVSFGIGLGATSLAETLGVSTVGILGGPAGWIGIGVGITVAIVWDGWIAPTVYENAGLNPARNLAPLQP